jgi:probable rRNA maturation factor
VDPDSRLRVTVSDGRGRPVRDGGLGRWLARIAPARARGEAAVALVGDARMSALNRRYRGKDAVTDVLAFPGSLAARRSPLAGDIVIATGVARRQAREHGHAYQTELRVLALHGLLHLLGYDHHARDDRGRMARLEAQLRRKGSLPPSLIERNRDVELRAVEKATQSDQQRLRPRRAPASAKAPARSRRSSSEGGSEASRAAASGGGRLRQGSGERRRSHAKARAPRAIKE